MSSVEAIVQLREVRPVLPAAVFATFFFVSLYLQQILAYRSLSASATQDQHIRQ